MPSYPGGVGLMIGIPHDGKPVTLNWAFMFKGLAPPMNFDVRMCIVQGKPVDEARCMIAQSAVDQKCKYLYFIDTDVTVPAHAIRQLIWHLEHYDGTQQVGPGKTAKKFAVAGGIYCHKSPPQAPMVFRGNGLGPYMDWKVGEVFEVSGIGMGCTLIDVQAMADLPKPWFKTIDDLELHKEGINQTTMWTEDLYFCKKMEDAGYGIMADGGLLCDHWDTMQNTPYSLPLGSKPWRLRPTQGKKVVDLGCGPIADSYRTDEGDVLRVDIREEVNPDYRCDLRHLPFAGGEFDVVFSSHTLEHFTRMEGDAVIKEMVRVMKPDGELRLVLPDLKWAAQHIVNEEVDMDVMNVVYGAQSYRENYHYCGYTQSMLEQLLRQNGFVKFLWDRERYHMMVRAWRKADAEITLLNPVFQVKTVEVAKMVEEFKDGHDPTVVVDEQKGSVQIFHKEKQYEEGALSAIPSDGGDAIAAAVAGSTDGQSNIDTPGAEPTTDSNTNAA
jgi:predicted SAM-dependent methyltransferase